MYFRDEIDIYLTSNSVLHLNIRLPAEFAIYCKTNDLTQALIALLMNN